MIRLCLLAPALLALAACQTAPDVPELTYEFVDLTDEYVSFWDRTQALGTAARVDAFKSQFGGLLPDFYDTARFADQPAEQVNQRIARSFERFPGIRERYERKAAAFDDMIRPAIATFRRSFPDMQAMVPVYLLHSLGEMDGGTRTLSGRLVLIFGADVMADVHDFEDEEPFLQHELFHVYHQQFFAECPTVWCGLWTEGLAVYVAHQLNPDATDSQLLLTVPEPVRAQVDAHLAEAVCATKARLESTAADDVRALFSFKRLSPTIPPRAGYYIGYLVAQEAGATRSIAELARLPGAEVRPLVEEALAKLAKCE